MPGIDQRQYNNDLPHIVQIAVGMKVITQNVETISLDITNGD